MLLVMLLLVLFARMHHMRSVFAMKMRVRLDGMMGGGVVGWVLYVIVWRVRIHEMRVGVMRVRGCVHHIVRCQHVNMQRRREGEDERSGARRQYRLRSDCDASAAGRAQQRGNGVKAACGVIGG